MAERSLKYERQVTRWWMMASKCKEGHGGGGGGGLGGGAGAEGGVEGKVGVQKNNPRFLSKMRCCGVMMDNFVKTSTM